MPADMLRGADVSATLASWKPLLASWGFAVVVAAALSTAGCSLFATQRSSGAVEKTREERFVPVDSTAVHPRNLEERTSWDEAATAILFVVFIVGGAMLPVLLLL